MAGRDRVAALAMHATLGNMVSLQLAEVVMGIRACTLAFGLALTTLARPASALIISEDYFEDSGSVSCGSASTCTLVLPLTDATTNKLVTLREISCNLQAAEGVDTFRVSVSDTGGTNNRRYHYGVVDIDRKGAFSVWQPLNFKITGGPPREIRVFLNNDQPAFMTAYCTVVGTLSTR